MSARALPQTSAEVREENGEMEDYKREGEGGVREMGIGIGGIELWPVDKILDTPQSAVTRPVVSVLIGCSCYILTICVCAVYTVSCVECVFVPVWVLFILLLASFVGRCFRFELVSLPWSIWCGTLTFDDN